MAPAFVKMIWITTAAIMIAIAILNICMGIKFRCGKGKIIAQILWDMTVIIAWVFVQMIIYSWCYAG